MIVELMFVLFVFLFCLIQNKTSIACLFIWLFPMHIALKQLFVVMGGGSYFVLWYDIVIFCFLVKALRSSRTKIPFKYGIIGYLVVAFFCFLLSFFASPRDPESLTTFRTYLHCMALFIGFSSMSFNLKSLRKIYSHILYSTLFNGVIALIIYFNYQMEWHIFLNHVDLTPNGVVYSSPSFLIMGIERLFGLLGGPNQFGAYMSVMILFLLIYKSYSTSSDILFRITLLISIACLILSFARAGWAVLVVSLCLKSILSGDVKKVLMFAMVLIACLLVSVVVLYVFSPDLFNVVVSTFNGEESSVAGRQDNVMNGIWEIVSTPWGHGLGAAISEKGAPVAESSMVVMLYELGVGGTLYYISFVSYIVWKLKRNKSVLSEHFVSFAITSFIVSLISLTIISYPNIYYLWMLLGLSLNPMFRIMGLLRDRSKVALIRSLS